MKNRIARKPLASGPTLKRFNLGAWAQAVCALLGAVACAAEGPAEEIKAFTGSRTRIVWAQDMGKGDDSQAAGKELRLMALDTADGQGERPVLEKLSNYYKPLITPKGDRVVFTNTIEKKTYVVNWDGSGLREVGSGLTESVWRNPDDGIEWVYVSIGPKSRGRPVSGKTVERRQLDHPEIREQVWHNTKFPMDDFQLSHDGLRAAGSFPWPVGGLADLSAGGLTQLGRGCWPSMSPDDSYRCWIFEGSHRAVRMYQPGVKKSWLVKINETPTTRGHEVYHPRWSNHPQFICMTGPYGRIQDGGTGVEVYLGKFDPEFRQIEKWVQVTHNERGDFVPDVWIESASKPEAYKIARAKEPGPSAPSSESFFSKLFGFGEKKNDAGKSPAKTPDAPAKWPGTTNGWIFVWENGTTQGEIKDLQTGASVPSSVEPRGLAVYGRNREMDLTRGSFVAKDADTALLHALQASNQLSIEAVIVPGRKHLRSPAEIITFSSTPRSRNFSLAQEDDDLIFRIRTSLTGPSASKPVFKLCKLAVGEPSHVIVTYRPGRVACYLNGKKVFDERCAEGDLSNWTEQHLVFGDEWRQGSADWPGRLEGIAIFNRALDVKESGEHYTLSQQRLKDRKPVERIVVRARLLSVTPPPSPESIAPYRRALVVNDYEVEEVLSGSFLEKKLQAARWGVLDSKVLPQNWKIGSSYELTLEKFSDQPQLEGERLMSESDNFDLTLFYLIGARKTAEVGSAKH